MSHVSGRLPSQSYMTLCAVAYVHETPQILTAHSNNNFSIASQASLSSDTARRIQGAHTPMLLP
eukprot:scaffold229021_cov18-Tisochrysis_lutea.AAC.2